MENLLPWFALKSVPGVGNHIFKRLWERFKTPECVFAASHEALRQVDGLTPRLATAIKSHQVPARVQAELERAMRKPYGIVTLSDPQYPPLLREIPDPPPFLYVHGRLDPAERHLAVVGSRNATAYGISTTRRLCSDLATHGLIVVSGMARGIDTAAHTGALQGQGRTVAVLGSGLEKIYPIENKLLFHKIAENGAVVSEFPLQTEPEPHNFPMRNRIISGVALGTVIVEATRNSGSLITARLATDQGREVFAVPGSVQSFKSTGTHALIKQGAKLVEHVQDILEELPPVGGHGAPAGRGTPRGPAPPVALTPEEAQVTALLGPYPQHIDELARKSAMGSGKLSGILLQLELKGMAQQFPGKLFSAALEDE
jgi:DNA processing protein